MKKLLAVILCALMVLSMAVMLSACGEDKEPTESLSGAASNAEPVEDGKNDEIDAEKEIVGEWTAYASIQKMMEAIASSDASMEGMKDDLIAAFDKDDTFAIMKITISDDYEAVVEYDLDGVRGFYEDMMIAVGDVALEAQAESLGKTVDELLAEEGMTREQYEEAILAQVDTAMTQIKAQNQQLKANTANVSVAEDTIKLKAAGGTETWTYEFESESEFIVTEIESADENSSMFSMVLPLTFKK